ncbi:hypothetical protein [Mycobacterium sp. URHB0044]|uniref:hypothetical protein n=1 Tax=Mycobacterium sp. URHB0044 TaxID=1380386 RepID=UPI00048F458F|nr:hypothetical protein [Mycobacterium sp. URHB0044]
MDLTWWPVAIAGCVGLAICIVAVLMLRMAAERRRLLPLANVGRLARLPEYVRAARMRSIATAVTIALLVVMFATTVVAAARPTGLPTAARASAVGQPQDIMVCVGGPVTDPAVSAVLSDVAREVKTFTTERVGLTSPNRRVIPLTRDYQYAAGQFAAYAQPRGAAQAAGFAPSVSYSDYAQGVEDVLALCLAGFPSFDEKAAQRRSIIYVGPDALRAPDETRPALFTADRVRDMARTAGIQVNVLVTGADSQKLTAVARDTGGRSVSADADVTTGLADIRTHPPAATATAEAARTKPTESPDVPLGLALLAAVALAAWPVVMRR